MADYVSHEQIVIAALVALTLAWLKLMRQKGDPRLIAACGLLAYLLPIVGPLSALLILNLYDRRRHARRSPLPVMARDELTLARERA